jgi:hypothetical protein
MIDVIAVVVRLVVGGVHKKSDFFPLRKKGANSG